MIKQVGEIITNLEQLPQTVEVRGAINAALRLRGALGQVTFPEPTSKLEDIEVVDEEVVESLTASEKGIVNETKTEIKK